MPASSGHFSFKGSPNGELSFNNKKIQPGQGWFLQHHYSFLLLLPYNPFLRITRILLIMFSVLPFPVTGF